MDSSLAHADVCVRALDGDELPVMPGAWTVERLPDSDWHDCRSADGQTIVSAWRANSLGAEALYMLFGPQATLDAFAAIEPRCMPARELWALAVGGNATAIAVARRWPTWRFSGAERVQGVLQPFTGVARLIFEGQALPTIATAFPWRFDAAGNVVGTDGAAQYRVNSITRPAMLPTIAGYACHTVAEDEPART